ncbi:MAG: DUF4783 domain-containing protein [Bacteroidetes bacterium]|nr:DUF4783 domain-containing protein [Bacteroidota bacterium]
MKLFLSIILFFTPFFQTITTDITRSLNEGNTVGLSSFLDSQVEISMAGLEETVSKAETIVQLKKFFLKNPVKNFTQAHQGNSKGNDSTYIIGNLNTQNGIFRVYIYVKIDAGKQYIQEIRFDKD